MNKLVLGKPGAATSAQVAPHQQVAALCFRIKANGKPRVLLVTSRDTGRYVLPKGWPMKGRTEPEAAQQEAWEEAGVRGPVTQTPMGLYHYDKRRENAPDLLCRVNVYALRVKSWHDEFPERGERDRVWMRPSKAAEVVHEPELKLILRNLKGNAL